MARVDGETRGVEEFAEADLPPLPTFLIIGAQKSATRWLRFNLGLHLAVFTAARELEFFNNGERYRELGPAWYRAQFVGWAGEAIRGEATPGYMFWPHRPLVVSERIALIRHRLDEVQLGRINALAGLVLIGFGAVLIAEIVLRWLVLWGIAQLFP